MSTRPAAETPSEEGGDPACWLHFVCPHCGRMREEADLTHCPNCGEPVEENPDAARFPSLG
jgi:transcription initiation factor IIE alpha subunit